MAHELIVPGFRKEGRDEWIVGVVRAVRRTSSLYRTAHLRRVDHLAAATAGEILEAPEFGVLKQDINVPEARARELADTIALLRGITSIGTIVGEVESSHGDEIRIGVDCVADNDTPYAYVQRFFGGDEAGDVRAGMGGIWLRLGQVPQLIDLADRLALAARPGSQPQPPSAGGRGGG